MDCNILRAGVGFLVLGGCMVSSLAFSQSVSSDTILREHCIQDDKDTPVFCFLDLEGAGRHSLFASESVEADILLSPVLSDLNLEFHFVPDDEYLLMRNQQPLDGFLYTMTPDNQISTASVDCDGWWADWGKCAAGTVGGAVTGGVAGGIAGSAAPAVGTAIGAVGGAVGGALTGAAASCDGPEDRGGSQGGSGGSGSASDRPGRDRPDKLD